MRRSLSWALIVEDDAAASFVAEDSPVPLLHTLAELTGLVMRAGNFSVMQVGGCGGFHARPDWAEIARAPLGGAHNRSVRVLRAPRETRDAQRCAHGYLLSNDGARAWLEHGARAMSPVDRHLAQLHAKVDNFNVDFFEPPLLCQTHAKSHHISARKAMAHCV